ncbi:MAG TPA: DUF3108 domain-containing protein [Stellaceae bacterium]|nr:DUF3108 domain-containing protein [Stellaceae bacterium]
MRCGRWALLAGMAALWLPLPAAAAEVAALYQADWAGLPAGEIRLALRDSPGTYRDEIAIRTEGLPELFTRFSAVAVSDGRPGALLPAPLQYDARYGLRKKRHKRLVMRFAAHGGAVVADRGPGDTSDKPPLPERFRVGVVDPLSALTAIREALRRGDRGRFTVPVYDGARRFDVIVRVLPKATGEKNLHLALLLAPIAGFKGESGDDGNPDDRPRPARLTMTDDARLMPLSFSVSLDYLPLVIELRRWCTNAAACRW